MMRLEKNLDLKINIMPKYRIYALFDTYKKEIFYIGQTMGHTHYRLMAHIHKSIIGTSPVYERVRELKSNGIKVKILTLKEFDSELCILTNEKHGIYFEKIFIKEYSALGTLLNVVDNPLYRKGAFLQPEIKKELQYQNGKYFIESDEIKYLHQEKYNPFNNHRFKAKILSTTKQ